MRTLIGAALLAVSALGLAQAQQPLRIGSTLSLTGPLGPTSAIHKVAGEVWVDEVNRKGGLLGRKVEWVMKDDQSRPDLARTLYEQLLTVDKVDLIVGPYATANILSAMGVAQRYNKLILHNSFGTPRIVKYDLQFPTSGGSGDPELVWPNLVFDAVASAPQPPAHFYMFPSPGPTAKLPEAKGALAFTTFEEHPPMTSNPRAAQYVKAFHERAKAAGLPDTAVDLHASISYSTWQTLEAAINGAKSVDDKALAQWLRGNSVDTIMGRLSWPTTADGPPNYMMGKDIYKIKQLQEGKWLVVWPKEFAAPGARLQ